MFNSDSINVIMNKKRKVRADAITALGGDMAATLIYDFECAPMTTNRKQLAEIGVDIKPIDEFISDEDIESEISKIVHGLYVLGIEVRDTNHLSSTELYKRFSNVLDEEIRDIPYGVGVSEILSMNTTDSNDAVSNRDSTFPRFI